jgi:hypothetical protein
MPVTYFTFPPLSQRHAHFVNRSYFMSMKTCRNRCSTRIFCPAAAGIPVTCPCTPAFPPKIATSNYYLSFLQILFRHLSIPVAFCSFRPSLFAHG